MVEALTTVATSPESRTSLTCMVKLVEIAFLRFVRSAFRVFSQPVLTDALLTRALPMLSHNSFMLSFDISLSRMSRTSPM